MNKKVNLLMILFSIYCLFVIWIILFKLSFSISDLNELKGVRSINFIPFHYDVKAAFHFKEVVENIIIFMPIGIYLKMFGIRSRKAIIYGLGLSGILEILQFVLGVGASDITDIITNTAGTATGVYLYVLLNRLFQNTDKVNNILKVLALIGTILFPILLFLLLVSNL